MKSASRTLSCVIGVLLTVTACGDGRQDKGVASLGSPKSSAAPTASVSGNAQQAALTWAKCMRERGLDVPDPQPGQGLPLPGNPSDPKIQKAMEACRQYLPPTTINPDDPTFKRQMAEYTKCLHEHGVDMPEPDANGMQKLPPMSDPKVEEATKACAAQAPGR